MRTKKRIIRILSWALYDTANQFFALNVVSLYFVRWLTIERGVPEIFYGLTFGVSMFFVAVLAPWLGRLADRKRRYKSFFILLTLVAVVFTVFLGCTQSLLWVLVFFAVANFGCQEAVVFYNALMCELTPPGRVGLISGVGKMFGYLGAILALYLFKPIILEKGYQATFVLTGILFFIFALPAMIFLRDPESRTEVPAQQGGGLLAAGGQKGESFAETFRTLKGILFHGAGFPGLSDFLKASFFGLCAVNAIILFMSVYATKVFGLSEVEIIHLLALSTLFAILGSILSGFISDYVGHGRCLVVVFVLWGVCFLAGGVLGRSFAFLVGALAGFSLGATWVLARALVVKLAPEGRLGEVFGLFNLVGYLSGIVGPVFWGLVVLALARFGALGYRLALISLLLFIGVGLVFLLRVPRSVENDPERVGPGRM